LTNPGSELDPATAVTVGRILSAHGIRGAVKVLPLSDFPARFKTGVRLWLKGVPVRIRDSRWQGKNLTLQLEGIDDRNAAEAIAGEELLVPEAAPLDEEGVYYQHDILGLTALDLQGDLLGEVVDIFSTGSNDVYVIRGERGELLLPALDDVVRDIDLASKTMTVELMEGLEFQGGPKPKMTAGSPYRRRKPVSTPKERTSQDSSS
jgi:16S rRNA processing protein RimM